MRDMQDEAGAPLTAADAPALARRWAEHGLELTAFEPASDDELARTGSTWARRLAVGRNRSAWRLELRRRVAARVAGIAPGSVAGRG